LTEYKERLEELLDRLRQIEQFETGVEYRVLRELIRLLIEREEDTREEDEQAQWIGKPIV
jgi:hypothetical protein